MDFYTWQLYGQSKNRWLQVSSLALHRVQRWSGMEILLASKSLVSSPLSVAIHMQIECLLMPPLNQVRSYQGTICRSACRVCNNDLMVNLPLLSSAVHMISSLSFVAGCLKAWMLWKISIRCPTAEWGVFHLQFSMKVLTFNLSPKPKSWIKLVPNLSKNLPSGNQGSNQKTVCVPLPIMWALNFKVWQVIRIKCRLDLWQVNGSGQFLPLVAPYPSQIRIQASHHIFLVGCRFNEAQPSLDPFTPPLENKNLLKMIFQLNILILQMEKTKVAFALIKF